MMHPLSEVHALLSPRRRTHRIPYITFSPFCLIKNSSLFWRAKEIFLSLPSSTPLHAHVSPQIEIVWNLEVWFVCFICISFAAWRFIPYEILMCNGKYRMIIIIVYKCRFQCKHLLHHRSHNTYGYTLIIWLVHTHTHDVRRITREREWKEKITDL